MPDLLVRSVSDEAKAELMRRASLSGRSLQSEARRILEDAALIPNHAEATVANNNAMTRSLDEQPAFSDAFDALEAVAARAEKRKRLFQRLDEVNSKADVSNLPNPADLVRAIRAEKDADDDRLVSEVLRQGSMA